MTSLLSSSVCRSTCRSLHPTTSLVNFIHSTPPAEFQNKRGKARPRPGSSSSHAPSRTRLVKDLDPRAGSASSRLKTGKYEVAPREDRRPDRWAPKAPPRRNLDGSANATPRRYPASAREDSRPNRYNGGRDERSLDSPSRNRDRPSDASSRNPAREGYKSDGAREDRRQDSSDLHRSSERSSRRSVNDSDWQNAPRSEALRLQPSTGTPRPRDRTERPPKIHNPLGDEFALPPKDTSGILPQNFTSPPLLPGLLASVKDILGPDARPTSIQALSLKHLFHSTLGKWHEFLLASETGSGKSMAYLLPMLQNLKATEQAPRPPPQHAVNPRALVLAPTHELSRQLAGFAKALLHREKLRVLCASRANVPNSGGRASQMAAEQQLAGDGEGEFTVSAGGKSRPVDVLVGTPAKVLEMAKGRGWDWERKDKEKAEKEGRNIEDTWERDEKGRKIRSSDKERRPWVPGTPEMGLEGIEWVIVDEADVLFDPDFQESTRMLLADIASARGTPVPFDPADAILSKPSQPPTTAPEATPAFTYPFNLILTTATIPSSLASYLATHHPTLTRLASPRLHRLPTTLQTEYAHWTGGNRNADIERRIRRVWAEDATKSTGGRSRVLVFCNRSTKVEDLGHYLEEKGIANVALTSTGAARKRGSNHHLDGFLRTPLNAEAAEPKKEGSVKELPYVMITTSLLSRGLDFAPSIKHVFIMDEPRNMVDFLHRAGRSGRAGERGKVVIFGKMSGRGSDSTREVRKKVGALAA